jgi:hypothetical protein
MLDTPLPLPALMRMHGLSGCRVTIRFGRGLGTGRVSRFWVLASVWQEATKLSLKCYVKSTASLKQTLNGLLTRLNTLSLHDALPI